HHEVEVVRLVHDVDGLHDVRMTNAGDDARFVHEHRDELRIAPQVRVEALHGDGAAEADRAEQPAEMDRGHPARRQLVEQSIAPNDKRPHARSSVGPLGRVTKSRSLSYELTRE